MIEEQVGEVVKFFAKPSVAAIKVIGGVIAVGDRIKFKGHTTDFEDTISSMQIENKSVEKAAAGDLIGIQVKEKVREGDAVFKLVD
jgi:translation elongation factor EF-1alpha